MTLPQQPLPSRRRQILDDRTGDPHRFFASEYEDTWMEEIRADENWLKRFMAYFAGLVRSMGGRK